MEYWVTDFGADGFRCDVSDGIPIGFWETARDRLEKIRPDICLLAEGNRYADQLKAFDLNYCVPWMRLIHRVCEQKDPVSHLRQTWESLVSKYPRGARLIRFVDNHDIANDAWHNRLDKKWGSRCVDAALVLHFTIDGVPFLYNGQEIADTARHSIYGRLPIDWSNARTPTGKARFAFCQKLCRLRRAERALTHGDLIWLDNDQPDSVTSFVRRTDREEILSVVNLMNRPLEVRITLPEQTTAIYRGVLREGSVTATSDGLNVRLESFGFFVGRQER